MRYMKEESNESKPYFIMQYLTYAELITLETTAWKQEQKPIPIYSGRSISIGQKNSSFMNICILV